LKKKSNRRDGYVLQSILTLVAIVLLVGIGFNSAGCGGGGTNGVIPNPTATTNPQATPTNTPVPLPTDNTVTRLVVTTQNPPRPNGKITANLLATSEAGELVATQVESILDNNGAGTIDLKKNSSYDANLYDQSDFNNPVNNQQVNTGNDALQNLVWDGGQVPPQTVTITFTTENPVLPNGKVKITQLDGSQFEDAQTIEVTLDNIGQGSALLVQSTNYNGAAYANGETTATFSKNFTTGTTDSTVSFKGDDPVVNIPPNKPSDLLPTNGATDQELSVTISGLCSDNDGDTMSVKFYKSDGSELGTVTNIASGNRAQFTWSGLAYSTTYQWYMKASDQEATGAQSEIFSFTTKDEPSAVTPPNPGTVQDFVTLPYDIEGIAYNPNNGHFYFGQSNATIVEYEIVNDNAQYVTATTGWGGGAAQPSWIGICFNSFTSQVGGYDSWGRIIVYSSSDLSYIKRATVSVDSGKINVVDNGNWIIAHDLVAQLEHYYSNFTNNETLTPYDTTGDGLLSSIGSYAIDQSNRFVCADNTSNKLKIINSNNTLHDEISHNSTIDLDTFYQYYFVTHSTQGYMNIIDSSNKSILVNNVTGVSAAKYLLIVNRTCYFSTAQKKIRFFEF